MKAVVTLVITTDKPCKKKDIAFFTKFLERMRFPIDDKQMARAEKVTVRSVDID